MATQEDGNADQSRRGNDGHDRTVKNYEEASRRTNAQASPRPSEGGQGASVSDGQQFGSPQSGGYGGYDGGNESHGGQDTQGGDRHDQGGMAGQGGQTGFGQGSMSYGSRGFGQQSSGGHGSQGKTTSDSDPVNPAGAALTGSSSR